MKKVILSLLIISSLSFAGCSNINTKAYSKPNVNTVAQKADTQYYFTKANQHPDKQLISVIDSAKTSLDIAIYSLTKKEIVDSIINAKNRGVTVRIMTDNKQSKSKTEEKQLALLKNANVPIKINTHAGLLHLKMTIADKSVATVGSYNYTQSASTQNDEVLVVINDNKVATGFEKEFEDMWNNTKEYQNYN